MNLLILAILRGDFIGDFDDFFSFAMELENEIKNVYVSDFYNMECENDFILLYYEHKQVNTISKRQTKYLSHKTIAEYIEKYFEILFPNLVLIGREFTLNNGRIDFLAKELESDVVVGIELKIGAQKNEYAQFLKYKNDLKQTFGANSRLIILSSRFSIPLLFSKNMSLDEFELLRYEVLWERIDKVCFIRNFKIVRFDKMKPCVPLIFDSDIKIMIRKRRNKR